MNSEVIQRSDEWFLARRGRFTASSVKNILMAPSTKGYQDEVKRVVFERITGLSPDSFESEWMTRGKEMESEAINHYQATTFNVVEPCGFFTYEEWMGASPDGLIGEDGLIEVKCPKYSTMIDYLLSGKVPKDYYAQIQMQLLCTGRKWCDFVAYHPGLRLLIISVERDEAFISHMIETVSDAVDKVISMLNRLDSQTDIKRDKRLFE